MVAAGAVGTPEAERRGRRFGDTSAHRHERGQRYERASVAVSGVVSSALTVLTRTSRAGPLSCVDR